MTGMAGSFDVIVIGAGIAGMAVATELAADRSVLLLEQEEHPGSHSTGRSAALLIPGYGGVTNAALARGSAAFFHNPPSDWDTPLLTRRGMLWLASEEHAGSLSADHLGSSPDARYVDGRDIHGLCPLLENPNAWAALHDPEVWDIDVHALQSGYLRRFRRFGGDLRIENRVADIARKNGDWHVSTPLATYLAPVIINASGAWADHIAGIAGLPPLGFEPRRRTVITFDAPANTNISAMPCVCDVGESFYFKPESGRVLGSAADATLSAPMNAQPEEFDVALTIDRMERVTGLQIRRITSKWAGLRTFSADHAPVVGEDPRAPGFVWLAGLGGAGIMTSPLLGRMLAEAVRSRGRLSPELGPERFLE